MRSSFRPPLLAIAIATLLSSVLCRAAGHFPRTVQRREHIKRDRNTQEQFEAENDRGVLGQTADPARIRELLLTPVNHEVTPREPHNGYLILQGGLPETEEFVSSHWK